MWQNSMFLLTDVPELKREGSTPAKMPAWKPTPQMRILPLQRRKVGAATGSAKVKQCLPSRDLMTPAPPRKPRETTPARKLPDVSLAGPSAAEKSGNSDKQYYKIHRTKGHALQDCRQVELLAEKQRAEYERRDKEKGQDGAEGSGKKRDSQACRRGKDKQQERPAQGRDRKPEDDNHEEDDESGDQGFQKATEAMCVEGGASLHTSHRRLK